MGNIRGKKILDVGCEAGFITMQVAKAGAHVTGVDLIEEPLEKFRQILQTKSKSMQKRITIQLADARKLPFKKHQFDFVVAAEVIEHIRQLSGFVNGAWKALDPKGLLIITFPREHVRQKLYPILSFLGINAGIESQVTLKEYQPDDIKKTFAKKFTLVKDYHLPWWLPITHLMVFKPRH
jgi:2-polyprenyl-3-methyl-5-hydroxy-6-metoxy-1,4-benzoquinol methylase